MPASATLALVLLHCCARGSALFAAPAFAIRKPLHWIEARALVVARANNQARRKAKSNAMKVHGRKGVSASVDEFGVPLRTGDTPSSKGIEVLLLKDVDGIGAAGDMVQVKPPIFENVLRPSGKARLPRAADLRAKAEAAPASTESPPASAESPPQL